MSRLHNVYRGVSAWDKFNQSKLSITANATSLKEAIENGNVHDVQVSAQCMETQELRNFLMEPEYPSMITPVLRAVMREGGMEGGGLAKDKDGIFSAVMEAACSCMTRLEVTDLVTKPDTKYRTPFLLAAASGLLKALPESVVLDVLDKAYSWKEGSRDRCMVEDAAKLRDPSPLGSDTNALSLLLSYGCQLRDEVFDGLLEEFSDSSETIAKIEECFVKAMTISRNPFIPGLMLHRAIRRSFHRNPKDRQFLHHLKDTIDELTLEILERLPHAISAFDESEERNAYRGYLVVRWILEPQLSKDRPDAFKGPLMSAIEERWLDFLCTPLVLDFVLYRYTLGLPGPFDRHAWNAYNTSSGKNKHENWRRLGHAHGRVQAEDGGRQDDLKMFVIEWSFLKDVQVNDDSASSFLPGVQFLLVGLAARPDSFYSVPAARMAFDFCMYMSFVIVYSYTVVLESPTQVDWVEIVFYFYIMGIVVTELKEAKNAKTLRRHFSDEWNIVDAMMLIIFVVAGVCRVVVLLQVGNAAVTFYLSQLFLALGGPLLFSRTLFLAQIDASMGPMVQVIFRMLTELFRFSLILIVIMLGFAMAFFALFSDRDQARLWGEDDSTVESYKNYRVSVMTLFRAALGDFDLGEFYGITHGDAGIVLMVVYLTIMTVMLLNLLIAVLSTAHAKVADNAEKEFQLSRTLIIEHYARVVERDSVPSPLNIVQGLAYLLEHTLRWPISCVFPSWGRKDEQYRKHALKLFTGRLLFWLVMGPLSVVFSAVVSTVSFPYFLYSCLAPRVEGAAEAKPLRPLRLLLSPVCLLLAWGTGLTKVVRIFNSDSSVLRTGLDRGMDIVGGEVGSEVDTEPQNRTKAKGEVGGSLPTIASEGSSMGGGGRRIGGGKEGEATPLLRNDWAVGDNEDGGGAVGVMRRYDGGDAVEGSVEGEGSPRLKSCLIRAMKGSEEDALQMVSPPVRERTGISRDSPQVRKTISTTDELKLTGGGVSSGATAPRVPASEEALGVEGTSRDRKWPRLRDLTEKTDAGAGADGDGDGDGKTLVMLDPDEEGGGKRSSSRLTSTAFVRLRAAGGTAESKEEVGTRTGSEDGTGSGDGEYGSVGNWDRRRPHPDFDVGSLLERVTRKSDESGMMCRRGITFQYLQDYLDDPLIDDEVRPDEEQQETTMEHIKLLRNDLRKRVAAGVKELRDGQRDTAKELEDRLTATVMRLFDEHKAAFMGTKPVQEEESLS